MKRGVADTVGEATAHRLAKCLAPPTPPFDGRQTKREGAKNPIHYAQHATATCCRRCVEYFYGIPQGRELERPEVDYFTELIMRYMLERILGVTPNGEKVPPIRSRGSTSQ